MKTIGHYEITGTLGQGGMGIVYAAWDSRLNRAVALKTIRANDSDPAATERLRREARAGARVNHPNICQLYDVGSEEGQFYIAMELLEGEVALVPAGRGSPAAQGCRRDRAVRACRRSTRCTTTVLIHRDLKPSNIFLTPHGVKLLDFGLALPLDLERPGTRLTMPGTIIGTPRYLSPEQLLGEGADHRGRHLRRRRGPLRDAHGTRRFRGQIRSPSSFTPSCTSIHRASTGRPPLSRSIA